MLLAQLARLVVRFPLLVFFCWGLIALVAIPKASHINDALEIESGAKRITEAKLAERIIDEAFPNPIGDFFVVAITGEITVDESDYAALVETLSDTLKNQYYISLVLSFLDSPDSAFVSPDRKTTFFIAAANPTDSLHPSQHLLEMRELIARTAALMPGGSSYEINVTGGPALGFDTRNVATEDARLGEERALPMTALVLVLAFGALVAAILPLIVGVFAITVSLAIIVMLSEVMHMSVFVLNIVTMIGLAVGIDYSLLIVTRFREELNHGLGRREAAERTVLTAGKAVITSGLTVAIGFASLLVTPAFETSSVGVGGMVVVTVAVLLSVTLLPAALALLGRWIDAPKALARRLAWYHAPSRWERWARWLAKHPWRAIVLGFVMLSVITWPLAGIKIGLPATGWFPAGTEAAAGVEQLEAIGSRGSLLPVRVVVRSPTGQKVLGAKYLRGLQRLSDSIQSNPRVSSVQGPLNLPFRSVFRISAFYSDLDRGRERNQKFFDAYISENGATILMDVILTDTISFIGSQELVREIRTTIRNGVRGLDSIDVLVGGFAASSVDLQDALMKQFPLVVLLVLVVTAGALFIAFQSVLVPIKAVIMNALSVGGAFGLIVLVFQNGFGAQFFGLDGGTEAVYAAVPILVFAVVFGLSMDYEVFLLSRIKEAYERTRDNDQATMEGLSATASVITSAAAIMIIVFGVSAFSRVLAAKLIGFGLAVAVFLDATIIRMVLVPAIMHIAGEWNWWPGIKPDGKRGLSSPKKTV